MGRSRARTVIERVQQWHWLLTVSLGVFLVMGFGFETPGSRLTQLDARIDSTNHHVDTVEIHLDRNQRLVLEELRWTRAAIEKLMIGDCLDRPRRETQLQGLPCDVLLNAARDHTDVDVDPAPSPPPPVPGVRAP